MGSEAQTKPRIIVVGAGVIGASIAWHLTRHPTGAEVTIVAEDVGGTATPCSFSWLNASWQNPKFYYDFRRRSMAGWRRLAEEVPALSKVLQWSGSLSVSGLPVLPTCLPVRSLRVCESRRLILRDEQWDMPPDKLAEFQKEHSSWGYDIHRIEGTEIHALEPMLSKEILPEWGLQVGEEGAVEAVDAAKAMVADAQERGARVVKASVTNLLRQGGDGNVESLLTSTGETLQADQIVLAAGVGSMALCASLGVTVPLKSPAPAGLLVHSKPVEKRILNHVVYNEEGHIRQKVDGRILAGSDFAGGEPGPDPAETARKQFEIVKASFEPGTRELLHLDFFTLGSRPQPVDGLPILGATGVPGLSLAVMHSGVTNAALVGELIAEMVLTGREDPALEAFALKRFSETQKGPSARTFR